MKKVIFMALATVFMLSSGFVDRERELSITDSNFEVVDFRKCDFIIYRNYTDPDTGLEMQQRYHYYNVEVGDQSCEQAGNTIVMILTAIYP